MGVWFGVVNSNLTSGLAALISNWLFWVDLVLPSLLWIIRVGFKAFCPLAALLAELKPYDLDLWFLGSNQFLINPEPSGDNLTVWSNCLLCGEVLSPDLSSYGLLSEIPEVEVAFWSSELAWLVVSDLYKGKPTNWSFEMIRLDRLAQRTDHVVIASCLTGQDFVSLN